MGVYTDIEAALNSRLDSLASHPPIAWPNSKYIPINGTTYLRPTLLPAATDLVTLSRRQAHQGIYQIDIYCPLKKGIATITTWMDAIEAHFVGQISIPTGSSIIHIKQSGRSAFTREDNWFSGYISINYICIT